MMLRSKLTDSRSSGIHPFAAGRPSDNFRAAVPAVSARRLGPGPDSALTKAYRQLIVSIGTARNNPTS